MSATPVLPAPAWPARDGDHLLVSAAQMGALEAQLFASGLPVEALMEKAALAVVRRLQQPDWWPQLQRRGVLVLVGPGHNGGDGLVVARELHLAGLSVRTWSPFEHHKPLTAAHRRHAQWLGIPELSGPPDPADGAIWIDALFGIGQSRAPGEPLETLLEQRQQQQPGLLIAIDGPTGLCADSGQPLGRGTASAGLTLAIGLVKQGWLQDPALRWLGQLERLELGLSKALLHTLPASQPLALHPGDLAEPAAPPWPRLDPAASKYQRGRLLVIAGSGAYRGAAALALQGASASGCGSLRAALPAAVAQHLWSLQPQVVLSAALPDNGSGGLALGELPQDALERLDAVVLGPGLGDADDGPAERATWQRLQAFTGLLLLDADGLNRLAPQQPLAWLRGRGGPTWLTPHHGEFKRLFPQWAELPPLQAASHAAAQSSGQHPCGLLLKGARSVVAAADGRRWQLSQASPAAARTGLGDVLAGYAGGLAARGLAAGGNADASLLALAALAHGCAGSRAAEQHGAGGATPTAVAEMLCAITQ